MMTPKLHIKDNSLEAIKWIGLALMVGDHVNKYLFSEKWHYLFNAGRAAMPLFVIVLAYNLARPNTRSNGVYGRTMKRLLIVGIVATPAFIALGGLLNGWWPLNIMMTLFVMTGILYLIERDGISSKIAAVFLLLIGGSSVEFWWPAILLGVAVWNYCKQPSFFWIIIGLAAIALLRLINGNYWAFAALPIVALVSYIPFRMPRRKWLFYAFYPAHLILILAVSHIEI